MYAQHSSLFYCDVMVNAVDGRHRMEAAKQFNTLFKSEMDSPNSFEKSLVDYKWISIKSDTANTFRIISWQVKDENNIHHQYGLLQTKEGKTYQLKDAVNTIDKDAEYSEMSTQDWYGALYYNLIEKKFNNRPYYLLFGYDAHNDRDRVKIVEILTFKDGKPVFGKELFKNGNGDRPDIKQRVIIDYTNIGNVSFNYNQDMDMIMYDHTILAQGLAEDGGPAKVSDGTYCGYEWDGKYWNFVDKINNTIQDPKDIFYQAKPSTPLKKKGN
jgi:hypothetical protein